jgi:AhpC/TSA family.
MKNRTFYAGLCLLMLLAACSRNPQLKVKGNISNAKGKTLYFELYGINKTVILDSVKLDEDGAYKFKTDLPGAPEFYQLRLGNQFIQMGADSTVSVTINSDGKHFGKDYTVEGSEICRQIKGLSDLQTKTLTSIDSLGKLYQNKQLADSSYQKKLESLLEKQRNTARTLIYKDPKSPAAYYALFQRIHNYLIFDPFNKADNRCYAAVATAWDTYYPKADRSKNIVNMTLQGLKVLRKTEEKSNVVLKTETSNAHFEIQLPNIYGKKTTLSSLRGKVVLLDFTAYQTEFSATRNLKLREIYNKYKNQGFEIYQISLDTDENFWKTGASNLPWVCVHDKNSIQSSYLVTYNVQALPTFFLIDRAGNIVARDAQVSDINKEIIKLL